MVAANRNAATADQGVATPTAAADKEREVLITRLLDTPRELVFRMWTEREHVRHWWQPKGFASVVCEEMDVRPGGRLRFRMRLADGKEFLSKSVYREIVRPERIVYDEDCDENGTPFHRARMTITFAAHGDQTLVTTHARFDWIPDRDPRFTPEFMRQGLEQGWNDNLDLLVQYLKSVGRT